MHYYKHHIGDFRRDTASLSDTDAMAYLKLLWIYYDTELPLPADAKLLAFKIGSNVDTVQLLLDAFFTLDGNVYRQKRCDTELLEYKNKGQKARESANARWNNANAMRTHSDSNAKATKIDANHKPITNNQVNKEYIDRFDTFWKHYPRKVAKPNALKAWLKLKPDDDLTKKIISAVSQQNLSAKEEQFIPHPASWLNARRWEDEVKVASTTAFPFGRRIL
jgi:uncharacterized protein YdaU (DUF1376 family)